MAQKMTVLSRAMSLVQGLRGSLDCGRSNIERNAVHYAQDIKITTKTENSLVIVYLTDQGPGVPNEALSRIFDPFYRPDAARGRSTCGSGLGLAITKRCIEASEGNVMAANRGGG